MTRRILHKPRMTSGIFESSTGTYLILIGTCSKIGAQAPSEHVSTYSLPVGICICSYPTCRHHAMPSIMHRANMARIKQDSSSLTERLERYQPEPRENHRFEMHAVITPSALPGGGGIVAPVLRLTRKIREAGRKEQRISFDKRRYSPLCPLAGDIPSQS